MKFGMFKKLQRYNKINRDFFDDQNLPQKTKFGLKRSGVNDQPKLKI